MRPTQFALVVACMVAMAGAASFAQQQQRGGGGERGPGARGAAGAPGGFDRAEMQARMLEAMRDRLGFDADEWTVVQPRLEKVVTLRAEAAVGGMGAMLGGGGRGQGGPGGRAAGGEDQSELVTTSNQLREVIGNESASATQIETALRNYREARAKHEEAVKEAQEELRGVLTLRQEATFVGMGILE